MPTPPDLDKPFARAEERAAARLEFARLGALVRQVIAASEGGPNPTWLQATLAQPLRGFREPPQERLTRYRTVFAEELTALNEVLDSSTRRPMDDGSLRSGVYLAQRLLASLLDCSVADLRDRLPKGVDDVQ